ncbi:MAG: putative ribose-phosphate pyrophosphokinase 2 [Gammaproteobacteria bacterium]|nr:putative ribose-phosphate pyrophosphokinase 2 [Gammaproteobacteria bacterium]
MTDPVLFALNASQEFGLGVAREIGLPLADHEEREFDDGEHKARPLVTVRNRDVYVIQSLYGDDRQSVNDKLCRLLFFLGALRDAAAARVTAVLPYLCYARKDIRTQTRDPITTRYVATLLEAVGVQRVATLEVHNIGAYQNAFRCGAEHLHTAGLFAGHIAAMVPRDGPVCVVSPDTGGVKRAERLRQRLMRALDREVPLAVMEKARGKGVLTPGRLIGEVGDGLAIVVDDMIGTGGTLAAAARACRAQGARRVVAAAAHGLFVGNAAAVIGGGELDQVLVTDTVPPFRLPPDVAAARLGIVSVVTLFAEAIRRMHDGGSLVELLED